MPGQDHNIAMRIRPAVAAEGCGAVIGVAGEIDLATAPLLHHAIVEQLQARYHTTVDLADVTFIDAASVRVLMQAHRTAASSRRRPTIANAPGFVARVLRLTQADQVLDPEDSDC